MRIFVLSLALLAGCAAENPNGDDSPSVCDGRLQSSEGEVDAPFDSDGDGAVDGNNADCAAVYDPRALDCDDSDPNVGPRATEISCNGIDDDCNPDTPDGVDKDNDGVVDCEDCDDNNPLRSPDNEEVCDDLIDNNCDEQIDEDCNTGPDYSGFWDLLDTVQYRCGPLASFSFTPDQLSILHSGDVISVQPVGGNAVPLLNGTIDETGNLSVAGQTNVMCTENWTLTGTMVSLDRFEGDLTIDFAGGSFICGGCSDREFPITAQRAGSP